MARPASFAHWRVTRHRRRQSPTAVFNRARRTHTRSARTQTCGVDTPKRRPCRESCASRMSRHGGPPRQLLPQPPSLCSSCSPGGDLSRPRCVRVSHRAQVHGHHGTQQRERPGGEARDAGFACAIQSATKEAGGKSRCEPTEVAGARARCPRCGQHLGSCLASAWAQSSHGCASASVSRSSKAIIPQPRGDDDLPRRHRADSQQRDSAALESSGQKPGRQQCLFKAHGADWTRGSAQIYRRQRPTPGLP